MKYLGILFFAVTTWWTWSIVHCEASMPFETHAAIQERLAEVIRAEVLAKKPNATEVVTTQIWTEVTPDNKIKAHFEYSFKEQDPAGEWVTSLISGVGYLEKQNAADNENEMWSLTKIKTDSDSIVFEKGLLIAPNTEQKETDESAE